MNKLTNSMFQSKPHDPVPSAYAPDMFVTIVETVEMEHFLFQTERVSNRQDLASPPALMGICYTKCENHFYMGALRDANFICNEMDITEQLQPVPNGKTVAVGFNPETQQWFGWSHRATGAFTIGSEVAKGDCAFRPSNREEFEESCKEFWDVDKKQEMQPGLYRTREFVDFRHDIIDPEVSTSEPIAVLRFADVYDPEPPSTVDPKASPIREMPIMYPPAWGRGAWKAETLEDAKQMAIDFANGVG